MSQNLKTRALLVKSDEGWEGLWIDKKLHRQNHAIQEGEDRGLYFMTLAEKYKLKPCDFQEAYANDKALEHLNNGGFPEDYKKVITMIDFEEQREDIL